MSVAQIFLDWAIPIKPLGVVKWNNKGGGRWLKILEYVGNWFFIGFYTNLTL